MAEPEPPSSPVSPDIERGASSLAREVWSRGSQPRSQLIPPGSNPAFFDEYLAYAEHKRWLVIEGDQVKQGAENPRPMEPIAPEARSPLRGWI